MSVQNKPDYKIFADGAKPGEVVTFPDVLRGWGVTLDTTGGIPPMEFFNSFGKRLNEWLMYLTQRGVTEWDASVDYPKHAMSMHGGVFYISIKESKNKNPSTSQAEWEKLDSFLGVSDKLDKTDGGKILAPISVSGKRVNSGIIVTNTTTDGNNVGDGQTQLGYNSGTEDVPVFDHYLRGAGTTFIDSNKGLRVRKDIVSNGSITPTNYTNFDNRFLQLSKLGDKSGQVPDMSLFMASLGFQGWQSIPSLDGAGNLILQWGSFGQFKAGDGVTVTFRKPFPNQCVFAIAITVRPSTSATTQEAAYLAEKSSTSARFTKGGTETSDGVWLALGY